MVNSRLVYSRLIILLLFAVGVASNTVAEHPKHPNSHHAENPLDSRQLVKFPEAMRVETFKNMRAHLLAIADIEAALARGLFDQASDIAEHRLGLSSLQSHGAHHVAKHMPKGMQEFGTAMHRSASQFAAIAQTAAVTNDTRMALEALSKVTKNCVACHAAYKLQ